MLVNIMIQNIIERQAEVERFRSAGGWIFVYGRRKTGKTFYVKNFEKWDEYFFVTRDMSVIHNDEVLTFSEFFPLFKSLLGQKAIVVDEFHRLPPTFLDYLHSTGTKGKLILISSTLWLSERLMKTKSPILGLFYNIPLSLIDERDILGKLKIADKKELVEAAVYLREPILIPHYKPPLRRFISQYLIDNKMGLQGLISEIFYEEEKYLSDVYDGIMHAVASGKNVTSEISSYLFSHGLIPKDNPGLIQRYLESLVAIGIFEKKQVLYKKKFVYNHVSPLLDLYFYTDEKYGLLERQIPSNYVRAVVGEKLPFHVERFVESLASKTYGMVPVKIEEPEIDFALVSFKKVKVVGEVKWKKIGLGEVKAAEDKLSAFDAEKLLVVPDKRGLKSSILKILEPAELLRQK